MPATAEEAPKVKVKLRQSLAGVGWGAEKGDVVEVILPDARRLIHRGIAEEVKESPLPKATKEEQLAAAVLHVETAGLVPRLGKDGKQKRDKRGNPRFYSSNRVLVRPAKVTVADEDEDEDDRD